MSTFLQYMIQILTVI